MTRISWTDLRQNLSRILDEAVETRAPIVVTRPAGRGNVVMLAESEFEGWQETVHLLNSPRNAERLLRAAMRADAHHTVPHDLTPPRASPPET